MIARYSRASMVKIWSQESRWHCLLQVEKAVASAQGALGIIPADAAADINKLGVFQIARIEEIERETRHDVIAFVQNVAENVGLNGRFVHFGLTSSDVLDTGLNLQIAAAGVQLHKALKDFIEGLLRKAQLHRSTLCAGRTHGMHAEPTTFGYKLLGFVAEFSRSQKRLEVALSELRIGKLSGAVGTYSTTTAVVEKIVCESLELQPELVATQVIPRDRLASLFSVFAILAGGLERFSVELRHLQRTEIGEVSEGFKKGQKGSSAMPHKKNPISSENITGCARLLRSYLQPSLENIALWHERDISHSSVERVILPDAFILCDYALDRATKLIDELYVDEAQMKKVLSLSGGRIFSSKFLLLLIQKGLSREEAYLIVQELSHKSSELANKVTESLLEASMTDERVLKLFSIEELKDIFNGGSHVEDIEKAFDRAVSELITQG